MTRVLPDKTGLTAAVDALRKDEVIAYPTETVYGLGVNPFSEKALDALFRVKEREWGKPVLLIVDCIAQIEVYLAGVSDTAQRCMERFWPGPPSLVLPAVTGSHECLVDKRGCICVRCPEHPIARELCLAWGGPITSTSANMSGKPPARCAEDALLPGVTLALDAGELNTLPPSTIFDPETGTILREGPITLEMLGDVVALSSLTRRSTTP